MHGETSKFEHVYLLHTVDTNCRSHYWLWNFENIILPFIAGLL